MLTIITGTPGAGKSLYTVWEIARHVPGSTVETDQEPVKRKLYSNIKNLTLEHEHINGDNLQNWHEWAEPGAVIVFDEVQEVWRPRALGQKVPDCIAQLETHRHKGVDIYLITQHPMLVDPNIRRLANQHLHLRRITKTVAMVYEWDHCANPGQTRTAIQSKLWFHPKKAYQLYKSAQLHTKPTARLPKIAFVGLAALAGLAFAAPMALDRVQTSLGIKKKEAPAAETSATTAPGQKQTFVKDGMVHTVETVAVAPTPALPASAPVIEAPEPVQPVEIAGCIKSPKRCGCFDVRGKPVELKPDLCEARAAGEGPPLQFTDSPPPPFSVAMQTAPLSMGGDSRAPRN